MLKLKNIDATEGPILKKILIYAIPLILGTLIQTLFNAVDMVVLGNMADSTSVAAVGATTAITSLLINSFIGLSGGAKNILARFFGSKDGERIKRTADTSMIMALVIGVFIALVCFFMSPLFLKWTKCPEECYDGALLYIRCYSLGAPAVMLYNFGSSILSASGDTKRPLYYIFASGSLNVILNIILCLILPVKVLAVAIATLASQVVSAALVIARLCKMEGFGRLELHKLTFCKRSMLQILRFGLPMALTHALYPISTLQIQSAINSYGVAATAGNSAGGTIEGIVSAFVSPFGATAATFVGQNLGVENKQRVTRSFIHCLWLGFSVGLVLDVIFYIFGAPIFLPMIVGNDQVAIEYGLIRMSCICLFYWVAGLNTVISNTLQSYGYSLTTTFTSIFTVFIFRFIWMWFVYPFFETFKVLMLCYTVSWMLNLVVNIVCYIIARYRLKKGLYARI